MALACDTAQAGEARMSSLFPHFPVFLDLAGRAVVMLGGETHAASLARQFPDSGASVTVFDLAPSDAMRALAPPVRVKLRRWRPTDFAGASLVIVHEAEARGQRARIAAHAAGAIVHAIGAPELSDIALGGVAARGVVALGVSAPGAPPALGEAIRAHLERALPHGLTDFLAAAARAAPDVERRIPDAHARDTFWRLLAEAAFDADADDNWDAFIAARLE